MQQWLQDFAYHIDIEWWTFAEAAIAAIVISLLTISIQSVKAAMTNPIESDE